MKKTVAPSPTRSPGTIWALATQFFVNQPVKDNTVNPDNQDLYPSIPFLESMALDVDTDAPDVMDVMDSDMVDTIPQPWSQAMVEDVPDVDSEGEDLVEEEEGRGEAAESDGLGGDEDDGDFSENEDGGESDDENEGDAQAETRKTHWQPPMVTAAKTAYQRIKHILHPPRDKGSGYKDPKLDLLLQG